MTAELGVTWIATCHSAFKPQKEGVSMAGGGLEASDTVQPLITGQARDFIPGAFDLVLHSEIHNVGGEEKFVLQWRSDSKKITKSRFGDLAKGETIPNDWTSANKLIELAKERQRQAILEEIAANGYGETQEE